MRIKAGSTWRRALGVVALAALGGTVRAEERAPSVAEGRALFHREWRPGDARSHGGDGLGPVYNDTSCIACHNAGGPGGAGPASKNVDLLTAVPNGNPIQLQAQAQRLVATSEPESGSGSSFVRRALFDLVGLDAAPPTTTPAPPDLALLLRTHPGFRASRSVVLHRFATEPRYEAWRRTMVGMHENPVVEFPSGDDADDPDGDALRDQRAEGERQSIRQAIQNEARVGRSIHQVGGFNLFSSQRNATALFGAGLIDAIPESVLDAAARAEHPKFPQVKGRVSRQKDGRAGRFGWKAQTPSLHDFVLTACAVELGLNVPGHAQGGLPQAPERTAPGLDLDARECASLVAYVGSLARPVERDPADDAESRALKDGGALFARAGCAECHTPTLGDVKGLYSDLLLHDLGGDLGDTGAYGVFVPDTDESAPIDAPTPEPVAQGDEDDTDEEANPRPKTGPATRQEWRTTPLWGFRDSGPYLHDGRAETLDQAVAFHAGEAQMSARAYFRLSNEERQQVEVFLKSLVAPGEPRARE